MPASVARRCINEAARERADLCQMPKGNGDTQNEAKEQLKAMAGGQAKKRSCALPGDYETGIVEARGVLM